MINQFDDRYWGGLSEDQKAQLMATTCDCCGVGNANWSKTDWHPLSQFCFNCQRRESNKSARLAKAYRIAYDREMKIEREKYLYGPERITMPGICDLCGAKNAEWGKVRWPPSFKMCFYCVQREQKDYELKVAAITKAWNRDKQCKKEDINEMLKKHQTRYCKH